MHAFASADMRDWDRQAIALGGISGLSLMRRAGAAVARVTARLAKARGDERVVIVAGKGNNGGDAYVAARLLHEDHMRVDVLLTTPPELLRDDAQIAWREAQLAGVPFRVLNHAAHWDMLAETICAKDFVVVDGLLGTGAHGPPHGAIAAAVRWILNKSPVCGVVAIDLPSGLDADTGCPATPCVRADVTVTFGAPKKGFLNPVSWPFLGHVDVADIGLPARAMPQATSRAQMSDSKSLGDLLPARRCDGHKGCYGHVLVIGGSSGLTGASALVTLGALRSGAGLVSAAIPAGSLPAVSCLTPGAMPYVVETRNGGMALDLFLKAIPETKRFDVIVAGPGMSVGQGTTDIIQSVMDSSVAKVLLDADALNVYVGRRSDLRRSTCSQRVILTPHPGEAARLLGVTADEVNADRVSAAERLACETGAIVVLKGAGTVIADPADGVYVNLTGNPAMATGGSGDVLAGIIAGLWAQGLKAIDAARLGVYLHGTSGDGAAWEGFAPSVPPETLANHVGWAIRWLMAV